MKDIKFDRSSFWVHNVSNKGSGYEYRCNLGGSGEGGCQWERFLLGEFSTHKGERKMF